MKIQRYAPQPNGWMDPDSEGVWVDIRDIAARNAFILIPDGEECYSYEMGERVLGIVDGRLIVHEPGFRNWRTCDGTLLDTMMAFKVQPVRLVPLAEYLEGRSDG